MYIYYHIKRHIKKAFLFSFLLLIISPCIASENHTRVYTIGVVPQFEVKRLHAIWRPILKQLELETGYHFNLRGAPNIPEFEEEFKKGQFDFAYMNPYHLIIANNSAGYIPLIRDHGRQLYGVLVVRKDSNIKDIHQLQNKVVAYPSPNALGASLLMRQELKDKFAVITHPEYVKTHDSVYLNVILGKASAGGGVQKTFNHLKPSYQKLLKIIYTTRKVAPHPLAVLPSVPKEVQDAVKKAFLKMGQTTSGKKLLEKIPIKQVGTAKMQDYKILNTLKLDRYTSR